MCHAWETYKHSPLSLLPWVGNIPLEEEMSTYSNILAWRIPWTEEPGGLQSIGLQSWTWLKSKIAHMHARGWLAPGRVSCDESWFIPGHQRADLSESRPVSEALRTAWSSLLEREREPALGRDEESTQPRRPLHRRGCIYLFFLCSPDFCWVNCCDGT